MILKDVWAGRNPPVLYFAALHLNLIPFLNFPLWSCPRLGHAHWRLRGSQAPRGEGGSWVWQLLLVSVRGPDHIHTSDCTLATSAAVLKFHSSSLLIKKKVRATTRLLHCALLQPKTKVLFSRRKFQAIVRTDAVDFLLAMKHIKIFFHLNFFPLIAQTSRSFRTQDMDSGFNSTFDARTIKKERKRSLDCVKLEEVKKQNQPCYFQNKMKE